MRGINEANRPEKVTQKYLKDITGRKAIQVLAAGKEDQPVNDSGLRRAILRLQELS